MAKFFETSSDIVELIEKKFEEIGLRAYGLTLKVMSTKKAKDVIKLVKANPATEYLQKREGIIMIQIFEEAFDRLDDVAKEMLVDMVLSNVSYDSDKDKVLVDTSPYNQIFRMRTKYGNEFIDKLELSYVVIEQIIEEEKARKEAEKEAKKNK